MHITRKITDHITYVGASDRRLARFENLFPILRGVSYNSYLITDEKTALLDTADESVAEQYFVNIDYALDGKSLDYLVIHHMEPDHCSLIHEVVMRYPGVTLVGNAKTFQMLKQFFEGTLDEHSLVVKEGDTLSLGAHTLTFAMASMVHWPEVMVSYESMTGTLFSADAFGTFGALNGNIFNDELDFERDWLEDARRYYTNIVGKYGTPVQTLLKKAAAFDIRMICPLHGPIWRETISWFIEKYQKWSTYEPEDDGILIVYGSMYGHTANAAEAVAAGLAEQGQKSIAMYDVSSTDVSTLIAESFRCRKIVLAAPTYNGGLYPPMENYLHDMKALALQKRTIAIIENGTWGVAAGRLMRAILDTMTDMHVIEQTLTVKSALKEPQTAEIQQLVDALR